MELAKFITYCTMKGYVEEHLMEDVPDWDPDAETYGTIQLKGRAYTATIKYATIGESYVVRSSSLFDHGGRPAKIISQAELRDITKAFVA